MDIQMINNFLSQFLCIELQVFSSYTIRPLKLNRFLDFEHQIQLPCLRPASAAPELRVKENTRRGLDLIQDCLALLFDLQPVCVSTLADATTPDVTSQDRESMAAHVCSSLRLHATQTILKRS